METTQGYAGLSITVHLDVTEQFDRSFTSYEKPIRVTHITAQIDLEGGHTILRAGGPFINKDGKPSKVHPWPIHIPASEVPKDVLIAIAKQHKVVLDSIADSPLDFQ